MKYSNDSIKINTKCKNTIVTCNLTLWKIYYTTINIDVKFLKNRAVQYMGF